jgi:hypothetical protein
LQKTCNYYTHIVSNRAVKINKYIIRLDLLHIKDEENIEPHTRTPTDAMLVYHKRS